MMYCRFNFFANGYLFYLFLLLKKYRIVTDRQTDTFRQQISRLRTASRGQNLE